MSPNPGSPARAQAALRDSCLFDFTKELGFAFSRQTQDGERQHGQALGCHCDFGEAHAKATMSHWEDRVSVVSWVLQYLT